MKKTVVQEPDHYMKGLQRHHDELRWLYMELYGNDSMFAELCDRMGEFYRERKQAGDSEARLSYLAGGIAKIQAGQVQIALSLPVSGKAKKDLCRAEAWIVKRCPAGYYSNKKISLWILRASRYHLYGVAALIFRIVKNKR